jgi:hypothetical protein
MTSLMISDTIERYGDFRPQCLSSQLGEFAYLPIKPDGSARPQVIILAFVGQIVSKFDNMDFYLKNLWRKFRFDCNRGGGGEWGPLHEDLVEFHIFDIVIKPVYMQQQTVISDCFNLYCHWNTEKLQIRDSMPGVLTPPPLLYHGHLAECRETYRLLLRKMQLTLLLLTCRIRWAPNNVSRWQMGFNLAFKGLKAKNSYIEIYWSQKTFLESRRHKLIFLFCPK